MDGAFYSPSTPTGSAFCHLTSPRQLCPLIMEKLLVLLLVTLAVAYAVPDPRGIIINLVRMALDLWGPPGLPRAGR